MTNTCWYIVDGYRPPVKKGGCDDYEGHECVSILNCNDEDAHCLIDLYFADREPVLGIPYLARARRNNFFKTNDKNIFGDIIIPENYAYSMRIRSDVEIIVQYGRMDINQDNLAYISLMAYPNQ